MFRCNASPLRLLGYLLLTVVLGALLLSSHAANAQSGTAGNSAQAATPHDAMCDGQNAQHKLSTKAGAPDAAEGQEGSQADPETAKRHMGLSGLEGSTSKSAQENSLCRRDHNGAAKPEPQKDPADQPVLPKPNPNTPKVAYSNGELTVAGNGARLGQVLEAIKTLTGISLEVPAGSADDQIFDSVGPVPVREALEHLLYGSDLNYIILSGPQNPRQIQRLILTARASATPTGAPAPTPNVNTEQTAPATLYGAGFSTEASGDESNASGPGFNNEVPTNVDIRKEAAAEGKTPGQILDELQKKQIQDLDNQAAQQAAPQQ